MAGRIRGTIVAVAPSGDLVSDISRDQLRGVPRHDRLSVTCDGHATVGVFESSHSEPEMTLVAVWNDNQILELRLVGENASTFLGIQPGSTVVISW